MKKYICTVTASATVKLSIDVLAKGKNDAKTQFLRALSDINSIPDGMYDCKLVEAPIMGDDFQLNQIQVQQASPEGWNSWMTEDETEEIELP